jgi:hypothetical protein
MKLAAIISVILSVIFSCSGPAEKITVKNDSLNEYPYIIDIEKGFNTPGALKLSSIADSIRYVVLSKNKEVLISDFPFLRMEGNNVFINFRGLIYRFNSYGKFLNTIGKNGRGPEEYMPGSPFSFNTTDSTVIVKRNYLHDYVAYSSSGKFIKNILLYNSDNVWEFECFDDSSFMYTFSYLFVDKKSLKDLLLCGLFDERGKKISIIEHPVKKFLPRADFSKLGISWPWYTFYNTEVVLNYFDTIYKIRKDKIMPGFVLNWGKVEHRQNMEEMYYVQTEPWPKADRYGKFFEIYDRAYFGVRERDKYALFEYDKKTGSTRSMSADGEKSFGFINDLDGGTYFYPKWTNRAGNIWIDYSDAFEFKKQHNDELAKSSASDPIAKEKLRLFLKDLETGDNPVLKIVYLKADKK